MLINNERVIDCFNHLCRELGESGQEAIRIIIRELGGTRVTFPTLDEIHRELRNHKIRTLFTGDNIPALAERFEITERHVRNILSKER